MQPGVYPGFQAYDGDFQMQYPLAAQQMAQLPHTFAAVDLPQLEQPPLPPTFAAVDLPHLEQPMQYPGFGHAQYTPYPQYTSKKEELDAKYAQKGYGAAAKRSGHEESVLKNSVYEVFGLPRLSADNLKGQDGDNLIGQDGENLKGKDGNNPKGQDGGWMHYFRSENEEDYENSGSDAAERMPQSEALRVFSD